MTIWTFLGALWAIGVAFHLNRLRKNPGPDSTAREASLIARIKCGIIVYGLVVALLLGLGIVLAKVTQNTALFYDAPMALVRSPAFGVVVFAISWFAAPALMSAFPALSSAGPDEAEEPAHKPAPRSAAPLTPEPGVINLDPDAVGVAPGEPAQPHEPG